MNLAVVAVFGACGALLRFFISEGAGTLTGFPLAVLCINIAGCFALGWFYSLSVSRIAVSPLLRLGIGTGFLGALTTFSTFVIDTWKLVESGLYTMAEINVLLTIVLGVLFAWLGTRLGGWQAEARMPTRRG